jgi:ATP-dependent exoDNAse (exonuclease V) alpha subunit
VGDNPTTIKVLLLAPTGTAVHNIHGVTIHSALQLQLGQHGKSYQKLDNEKCNSLRCKLSDLQLIIIDEISMVGSDLLLQVHRRLQEIFQSDLDFAGISMITFEDLYQLPPVCQKFVVQSPSDEYARLCMNLWDNFKLIELTEIMRQKDDADFAKNLNRVRDGSHTVKDINILQTRNSEGEHHDMLHVYTTNAQVDSYNAQKLSELSGTLHLLCAIDTVPETMNQKQLPDDQRFTGSLTSSIELKIGTRVMLTRNLDVSGGFSNGIQGHIVGFIFRDQVAMAVLIKFSDTNIGKETRLRCKYDLSNFPQYSVPIERIEAIFSLSTSKKNIQATRNQFPIRLYWACTVHKIQGQSLEQVYISFEGNFTNGQSHVALSRATSLNWLFLSEFSKKKNCVSSVVKKEMTRLRQIQTDEPLLFKETNIDNILVSLI